MAAIYDPKSFDPSNGIGRLLGRVKMAMHEALERELAILELTPEGKAVYPKLIATYVNVLNRFMRGFTKAEAHQLETLLSRMLVND